MKGKHFPHSEWAISRRAQRHGNWSVFLLLVATGDADVSKYSYDRNPDRRDIIAGDGILVLSRVEDGDGPFVSTAEKDPTEYTE